jgi:diguanylate cyclase (GGDEF)-like protein
LVDVEVSGNMISYGGKEVICSVVRDITERRRAEEQLKYQALHDLLTDLPNRRLFVERLGHALERTRRRPGRKAAVLFVDLDNFKMVNDSLGHEVGDELLVAVAERLRGCVRSEDTLARFGGDEFAVLVEEIESPEDAVRVAERLREGLRELFVLDGGARSFSVTASVGIALGDVHTKSPEDLLRDVDIAMYRAKEEGAGHRVFDLAMHERAVGRLELEGELRRALENGEFVLHYQPMVSLKSVKALSVEALVRWEHPRRGLLPPSEFITIAEEIGLIVPLGRWVIEEACRQVRRWQERYPNGLPLRVAVNISAVQLRYPNLVEDVTKALRESGLDPSRLELEITESVVMEDAECTIATLLRLKRLGVKVAIDDFGTGYSSLSYLKRFPVDSLKVDGSFVAGLGKDPVDEAILTGIVNLAHALDLRVVAEWAERAEQVEWLREMGCDYAQGFFFSEPLPPDALPGFLAR